MNAVSVGRLVREESALSGSDGEVRRRKAGLLAILSEGLPTMPIHLFQLNAMLGSSPVDLKQVSAVIRSDPSLTAQLLRLCNSALFNLRRHVTRVEEAAILMGTERLRNLAFTCYLIQLSCEHLPGEQVESFWTHSLMVAMLSERMMRRLNLEDTDQAYLGGLLHDVGKLPLLMVAAEENTASAVWLKSEGAESLALEREYFGLDHCEVGRWLGINWNFDPLLVEVIESHHQPNFARFPAGLVGIVAAADHFCETMEAGAEAAEPGNGFYRVCLPQLGDSGRAALVALLRREYPPMRKMLKGNPPVAESDTGSGGRRQGLPS
ncbi:MAG: HDOD domain-containing protein [Acidobacteriota bacterium]|nr:HDOD domain-containing protein [Acidobacteriota bacterium]